MPKRTAAILASAVCAAHGGEPVGPDLVASDVASAVTFGAAGDIHSYALGVTACNVGDAPVDWQADTPRHPVLASQLYRLSEGRFEQIGLSWVFHEFFPLQTNVCGGMCTPPADPRTLGVGCGTTNSASAAGAQVRLGPRTEVDPAQGVFQFPPTDFMQTGDAVYKRLQASRDDLQTPGARYFVEVQHVALDDAQAGNARNNVSHREVAFTPATLSPVLRGDTAERTPAILAWAASDPAVFVGEAEAPDGGRYIVASKATLLPGPLPTYRYEYAVYNQDSRRNAVAFEAPHPGRADFPRAFGLGFHDVDYHSGEPVDGTDWEGEEALFSARWEVVPPPALAALPNELRWGTLYNARYLSTSAPVETTVRLTLSGGPGQPASIRVPALSAGPARCSDADFAEPLFVLDLADLQRFVGLFVSGDPGADIVPPLGVLDLADVQAFIAAFVGGCGR